MLYRFLSWQYTSVYKKNDNFLKKPLDFLKKLGDIINNIGKNVACGIAFLSNNFNKIKPIGFDLQIIPQFAGFLFSEGTIMVEIKKGGYVCIQEWMLNLGLNPTELMCLAVIFGFSQDGRGRYKGSASYLARWCCVKSKKTIFDALKKLVEKGIIIKYEREDSGVKFCDYAYNFEVGQNLQGVDKNYTTPSVNSISGGSVNFTPHNIDIDNIDNNMKENIKRKSEDCATSNDNFIDKETLLEQQASEIYDAYPKHKARPFAIRAIKRALMQKGYDYILERTKAYSRAITEAKKDIQYIPYPATWFNREEYNDNFDDLISKQVQRDKFGRPIVEQKYDEDGIPLF